MATPKPRIGENGMREFSRRPDMDRVWSPKMAKVVLDVISRTGSLTIAAKEIGISMSTIADHRRRDPEFRAQYAAAMDVAFQSVLGQAFTRSFDELKPSDRLIEVLLKLRFPERLGSLMRLPNSGGSGGGGLNPMVIARMPAADRNELIRLLELYQNAEGDMALDPNFKNYDADALPCLSDEDDS